MNNLDYIVFAFATPNYFHYLERLETSLLLYKIPYTTKKLEENTETKRIGSLKKPSMILDYLLSVKKPVLYVDSDSVFKGIPIIPNIIFDVGIVLKKEIKGMPIFDHISFYNYTDNAIKFLEYWKELCDNTNLMKKGDHKRLVLTRDKLKNKYVELKLNPFIAEKITGYDNNHKKYIEIEKR